MSGELIDVAHVSKRGTSLRITLPVKVREIMGIGPKDIIAFHYEDGKIIIEKMK